jgi:probable rRNA maturation factor
MPEIINRQRKIQIDVERWQKFTAAALRVAPCTNADVTVAFVPDRTMRALNRRWRQKQGTTDVLSFPAAEDEFEKCEKSLLGDVIISAAQAAKQARENKLTLDQEIAQLILHGVIHLCGFDHETDQGEMNRLELKLRRKLGI